LGESFFAVHASALGSSRSGVQVFYIMQATLLLLLLLSIDCVPNGEHEPAEKPAHVHIIR